MNRHVMLVSIFMRSIMFGNTVLYKQLQILNEGHALLNQYHSGYKLLHRFLSTHTEEASH